MVRGKQEAGFTQPRADLRKRGEALMRVQFADSTEAEGRSNAMGKKNEEEAALSSTSLPNPMMRVSLELQYAAARWISKVRTEESTL